MLLLLRACAVLAFTVAGAAAALDESDFPMRWRVFCDVKSGTSFQYPYELFPRDQYKGDLGHDRDDGDFTAVQVTDEKGKKVLQLTRKDKGDEGPLIHHFSYSSADLGMDPASALSDIGDREAKAKLSWRPFDYYQVTGTHPQGDPKWADEGIEAQIGEGDKRCALVVHHGDRWSGLVLKGAMSENDNNRILDSFEVLSTGKKLKKGEKADKKAHFIDWREAHCRQGKVYDAEGKLVSPSGSKSSSTSWKNGWEIETEHYHVTADSNPGRLLQNGLYLEALYRAYMKVYQPDDMPPYKFEVHIFNTYREFLDASASHGHGVPAGPGSIVGGFFVPALLSLWVYEESGKLGGDEFSIEHVMAHECSHQFFHVTCNGSDHIPTWINEGLAVYFESGVFQNGEFQIRSPTGRINELKQEYQQRKSTLEPLDKYLNHHGFISAAEYGEVFAMTSFWVFGTCHPDPQMCKHKDCGLKRFRDLFQALKAHEDGGKAFERIFMDDMIKAQGSREKAVALWEKALMEYVLTKLK